ncbi:MAG: tetratricopeptide repeat protein [Planctomycetes bacterium]|nr:tetratricopeptide repeat protein [Planctomycetota bacterium]
MYSVSRWPSCWMVCSLVLFPIGCATERAFVTISYVVEPTKGVPPGMNAVAVMDSKVNTVTDRKWSELAANMIQARIQTANERFGANLRVADRKHLAEGLAEQDLAAAGVTRSSTAGQGGQVMEVDGIIESEINVKVEKHRGMATTIAGLSGLGGKGWGGGDIRTRQVETVSRNMVVQTTFKLIDTVNNRNWITFSPRPFRQSDRTKTFFLFGSAQTEAALTPRDEIIAAAVEKGVAEFVSQIVPCEMIHEIVVESSTNKNCVSGVQMLRADDFDTATFHFKAALADDPNDYRAAFAAGVAAEASGHYAEALRMYRRAYGLRPDPKYSRAKNRLNGHLNRIRTDG